VVDFLRLCDVYHRGATIERRGLTLKLSAIK